MRYFFHFINEYNIDVNDPVNSLVSECFNRKLSLDATVTLVQEFHLLANPQINHIPVEISLQFFESQLSYKPRTTDVERVIEDYFNQLNWDWSWLSVTILRYLIASLR